VCAALLHKALREDQVIAVHIDNGFMRKDESLKVEESLGKIGLKLKSKFSLVLHYTREFFWWLDSNSEPTGSTSNII
jgi:GMP synthase PP-ATPase subunit